MALSYPTAGLTVIDLPDAKVVDARFVYQFFVQNESTTTNVVDITATSNETFALTKLESASRYAYLDIEPPNVNSDAQDSNLSTIYFESDVQSALDNGLINNEISLGTKSYTGLNINDPSVSTTLQLKIDQLAGVLGFSEGSQVQKYNAIASQPSSRVDIQSTYNLADQTAETGVVAINQETGDLTPEPVVNRNISFGTQFNNKFIGTAVKRAAEGGFTPLNDMFGSVLAAAQSTQGQTLASSKVGVVSEEKYEVSVTPYSYIEVSTSTQVDTGFAYLAMIVDKYIVNSDASLTYFGSKVISKDATYLWDFAIRYGETYEYEVKAAYVVRFEVNDNDGKRYRVDAIVAARSATQTQIDCRDLTPPTPIPIVKFRWDSFSDKLNLDWERPSEPQNDIKRYQIFRRSSINEPFQLIKQIDFDDSDVIITRSENIPDTLNVKYDFHVNYCIDSDFNTNSKYIYAIVAVDAHDNSSAYSTQYHVSYDRFSSKLLVKPIMSAGSPKPYPNFTIDQEFIEDAIRDSGHTKMRVIFNPDYLMIGETKTAIVPGTTETATSTTNIFDLTNSTQHFKLQLINADVQISRTLNINTTVVGSVATAAVDHGMATSDSYT